MDPNADHFSSREELEHQIRFGSIPPDFHSAYLSGPFVRCIECERDLLDDAEAYSILKAYVLREPVFEMAICAGCSVRLAESYSEKSKAAFEQSLSEMRNDTRSNAPAGTPGESPALPPVVLGRIEQLDHCVACGRDRAACRRYSIVGTFVGRALVSTTRTPYRLPLLICDDCNGRMVEHISRETRDRWDRYVEEHFDGPPGIELDSPQMDPILI